MIRPLRADDISLSRTLTLEVPARSGLPLCVGGGTLRVSRWCGLPLLSKMRDETTALRDFSGL